MVITHLTRKINHFINCNSHLLTRENPYMQSTWNVPTDQENKLTVESQLVYVMWSQGRAYAGYEAEFEMRTIMAGDGNKIKITCRTKKGKKLEKIEGALYRNRYRGKIVIPEKVNVGDYVYLEAEIPRLKLDSESNLIPVRPPLEVSSMKWSKDEVRRDKEVGLECIFSNGVEDGDEVTVVIYEYDSDGYHDKIVSIPTTIKGNKVDLKWNFIYQEDTDDILTDEEKEKYGGSYNPPEYFFVVIVDNITVGKKQESGLLTFKDWVEIEFLNGKGEPVADVEYELTFADGTTKKGKTTVPEKAVEKDIPPGKVTVNFLLD